MPEHNAIGVANEIIMAAKRRGLSVSPMQLQKLLYFCNGWNLEIRHEPLVFENFEAWQYGPVNPSVYREFRTYGSAAITSPATNPFNGEAWVANLGDSEKGLIDEVVGIYGKLTGPQMSNLTHKAGTPWSDVWRDGVGKGAVIPPERIKEEFQKIRSSNI